MAPDPTPAPVQLPSPDQHIVKLLMNKVDFINTLIDSQHMVLH